MSIIERKPRPYEVVGPSDCRLLLGRRCVACHYPTATDRPRCPACGGKLEEATFGPEGVVWSSTVIHVPVPGFEPPHVLAYVDLDNGPRVLASLPEATSTPPEPGSRVRIVGFDRNTLEVAIS